MAEDDVKKKIAAAEAAIRSGNIEQAITFRGQISRGVVHHPHLESVYYRIYDQIMMLQRGLPVRIS